MEAATACTVHEQLNPDFECSRRTYRNAKQELHLQTSSRKSTVNQLLWFSWYVLLKLLFILFILNLLRPVLVFRSHVQYVHNSAGWHYHRQCWETVLRQLVLGWLIESAAKRHRGPNLAHISGEKMSAWQVQWHIQSWPFTLFLDLEMSCVST